MMSFLSELRRRNVFRVAAAYLVVGWIVMQVVATIGSAAGLPDWADSLALIILVSGFPVILFIAWAFELTPEGMKKTGAAEPDEGFRPVGPSDYVLIAAVIVVIGIGGAQFVTRGPAPTSSGAVTASRDLVDPVRPAAASIAVLPFADLSEAGDQEYFGDGIAEEILNVLARIDALDVTSRTSAFAFKSQSALSIRDIAASLQVRHVLEGSVRTSGDMIRITAQLIDAETDQHLWSETFDRARNAENIFAIQDEISAAILTELTRELGLDVDTNLPSTASGGTSEISAFDAYLEGRTLFINRNYENLPLAIERLEYATQTDPDFARAWALLAVAYGVAPGWAFSDRDYSTLSGQASERALALDPDNSLGLTAMAQNASDGDIPDWALAIELYQRAIAADPNNATAHLWLSQIWRDLGFHDRREESARRCLDIEPRYGVCLYDYAAAALSQGNEGVAFERLLPLLSTQHAESYPAFLGVTARSGRDIVLRMMLRETADFLPGSNSRWIIDDLSRALSDEDYDRQAARLRFEARLRDEGFEPGSDNYITMTYLLAFGAYDEIPLEEIPGWWFFTGYRGLQNSDAAKNAVIQRGVLDYWRAHGFPSQCRPVGADDFECRFEDRS
ncbi:hypothetical protein [Hyphobacterium indicum]|uniref:hypothetical protein n=1 Tax=Hyphobacterium indicum TaxID=2162714 RepID=UPI000D6565A7|nr:hypothetical protein [Hyphobacterium indicum]